MSTVKVNRIENTATTDGGIDINTSGKVGIGTSSPNYDLGVHDPSGSTTIQLTNGTVGSTASDGARITGSTSGIFYLENLENAATVFSTNNIERMRIDSSGRLGVGFSSPPASLSVHAIGTNSTTGYFKSGVADVYLQLGNSVNDQGYIGYKSSDLAFYTSASERMRINGYGLGVGTDTITNGRPIHAHNSGGGSAYFQSTNDTSGAGASDGALFGVSGSICYAPWNCENGPIVIATNSTEAMRIDSSGNVLIGHTTASLATPLSVAVTAIANNSDDAGATTTGLLRIFDKGNQNNRFCGLEVRNRNSGDIRILNVDHATSNKASMAFCTDDGSNIVERMRINSNGRVDIGDDLGTAHAGEFQVINTSGGQQDNDALAFFETNSPDWCIKTNYNAGGTHYHMRFLQQNNVRGSISGNSGADVTYSGSSDYRLKENVVEITGTQGINICKKLKPSYFNWIDNRVETGETNTVDGFIAHEVQEAGVLAAVIGEKDAVNEDGSIDAQMMDYGKMTPVLSAAIKGLIDKIETLEQRLTDAGL